ncbi:hypothetical protein [Helicobacter zhangjianzhongii]|uniref:Uncharacterized protein n=1 Tax=Helicobacter zhangjianzhongii TaxID=2974574 RepID=A0ACC6FTS0_9HELI|nr:MULTISPECIES: hypothetical protein [unclassified Helicobacter]MDL0080285.1 hypothetical protein [Helicobacter sp. CPD2-1]MDL0082345.1 hypothetical protein [Helicobacter sp. XJK30-2]
MINKPNPLESTFVILCFHKWILVAPPPKSLRDFRRKSWQSKKVDSSDNALFSVIASPRDSDCVAIHILR